MLTTIAVIAIIIVVLVVAVLVYAATKPDTFRSQRSTSVKAPPEKIFAFINEFPRWTAWSPFEKLDPALQRSYSGAPSGKGAVYEWEGKKAGKGRMEIVDSSPPSKIVIKLDFTKPFQAHNTAEFTMEPKGDVTNITWAMHGPNLYVGKVMSIFVDMDKLIGKDFASGLATLKVLAEKQAAATA